MATGFKRFGRAASPLEELPEEAALGLGAALLLRHNKPDIFVLDYGLPGMNGIELYDRLHLNQELASIPAILITANRYLPQEQIRQRQLITFMKPFELDSFLDTIETLLTAYVSEEHGSYTHHFAWKVSHGCEYKGDESYEADHPCTPVDLACHSMHTCFS